MGADTAMPTPREPGGSPQPIGHTCATCRYVGTDDQHPGQPWCTIRAVALARTDMMWCVNHPASNPRRITLPVGPVYTRAACCWAVRHDGSRHTVAAPSLDTRQIRNGLLELLAGMTALPAAADWRITPLDLAVIGHVRDLGELRALPYLRQIATWHDEPSTPRRRALRGSAGALASAIGQMDTLAPPYPWERGLTDGCFANER